MTDVALVHSEHRDPAPGRRLSTLGDMEGLFAPWHILIVLVVALLVLGPSKLPEVGRQVGRGLAELRKFREAFDDDIRGFLGHHEDEPSTPDELSPPDNPPASDDASPTSSREPPPGGTGGRPPLPEGGD